MIIIEKTLEFRLFKDNNLEKVHNNVAYLKNFDKIVFELNSNVFNITLDKKYINLKKEDDSSIFYLSSLDDKVEAYILLKEVNARFDLEIESYDITYENNKYILEYKLNTDEEKTRIEIDL